VGESAGQKRYEQEAAVFARLGQVFAATEMPRIEVRLPRDLAVAAVASWERDAEEYSGPLQETFEQRIIRSRAADLSLIGLSISERGCWEDDAVVVALSPALIGTAMQAADELPT
jgi:hypothetical protein